MPTRLETVSRRSLRERCSSVTASLYSETISSPAPAVFVVGGSGFFGRLLLEDLLHHSNAHLIVGGRNERRLRATCRELGDEFAPRLTPEPCDLSDPASIRPALKQARLTICAAGPYQAIPSTLPDLCLALDVPYIDLSDDRPFVMRVRQNVRSRSDGDVLPAMCTGWSAVPALSAALTRIAADSMECVDAISIAIAPGNRQPRAVGTVTSLLHSVSHRFTILEDGRWREVSGSSLPRPFRFPEPVGRRTGFLVDVPDHELFPELFAARSVTFRVGSELTILNWAVSVLACLSRRGWVNRWDHWTGPLRRCMALAGFLGSDSGAVGVLVSGRRDGRTALVRASVVADREGRRIPVMPAAIMAQRLLTNPTCCRGLVELDRWIDRTCLAAECTRRSLRLVVEDSVAS